jgi:hypothetical protein
MINTAYNKLFKVSKYILMFKIPRFLCGRTTSYAEWLLFRYACVAVVLLKRHEYETK